MKWAYFKTEKTRCQKHANQNFIRISKTRLADSQIRTLNQEEHRGNKLVNQNFEDYLVFSWQLTDSCHWLRYQCQTITSRFIFRPESLPVDDSLFKEFSFEAKKFSHFKMKRCLTIWWKLGSDVSHLCLLVDFILTQNQRFFSHLFNVVLRRFPDVLCACSEFWCVQSWYGCGTCHRLEVLW